MVGGLGCSRQTIRCPSFMVTTTNVTSSSDEREGEKARRRLADWQCAAVAEQLSWPECEDSGSCEETASWAKSVSSETTQHPISEWIMWEYAARGDEWHLILSLYHTYSVHRQVYPQAVVQLIQQLHESLLPKVGSGEAVRSWNGRSGSCVSVVPGSRGMSQCVLEIRTDNEDLKKTLGPWDQKEKNSNIFVFVCKIS